MSGLQEAFYIMGIIFMSLFFLTGIALFVVALVIRAKINHIYDIIEHNLNVLTGIVEKGGELTAIAGTAGTAVKKAKDTLKNKK